MDNNLSWFQSLIGTISLFGQFAVPLIFAIISFIRRKKYIQGSKNIYGKIFLHIVVTTIISTILLDIILLIFCMKIFLGSGNFGIFILKTHAGRLISCLITVINLAKNVVITQCSLKYFSDENKE